MTHKFFLYPHIILSNPEGFIHRPQHSQRLRVFAVQCIEVQIIKYTRREGERRVRRTFFVRRRAVRLITPCNYLYELLYE